ncbi:glycoside hydrolase family 3 N-terminal domain-containing protein [Streptomyces marispadix]|uniref:Glycoside hydrolase family 3 protein n=1 Tax=Streptomyces marispadix TaxID=2922868 RepID=A0ABS9T1S3_9ACTN|nr:glycoside hydrolase family 3 N-terminal domain-containing protein [Streptomyces marispadix]MCH6162472.1 glycoside hydrolase family 3 protein [Streptomyces marispadix]
MTTLATGTESLTRDALTVLQPGFTGTSAPDWLLRQLAEGLTSVGLFGRNIESPEQLAALTAQLREVRPEVLVAIDEEGGDVTRLEARTGSSFPGNLALGHVDDTGLTRAVAGELGRRLAACGVNLNWAPSADVNSNPDNPVIGVRSFGDDPRLVARHTVAYVEGLQAAGVAACVKHFPGHGDTAVDSHHALPRIDADMDTLRERELVPFQAAIDAGTKGVMSAHILLPALDEALPGTLSPAALMGLLRASREDGGLGHTGLIVTDGMEMQAISGTYGLERGSVLAVAAGADALCVGGGLSDEETVLRLRDALVKAVRDGELTEQRLADAAARVRALARWTRNARTAAEAPAPPAAHRASGSAPDVGLEAARRALTVTVPQADPGKETSGGETPGHGSSGGGARRARQPLTEPPFVASFTPAANIAVGGETPWGVAAELARLLPGTAAGTYGPDGGEGESSTGSTGTTGGTAATGGESALVASVLADAADRRIVAVVRDVHRHPWMADALEALLAARPETVVVEMGVPQAPPSGALHIATHGAARVCGRAAAEVIAGEAAGG